MTREELKENLMKCNNQYDANEYLSDLMYTGCDLLPNEEFVYDWLDWYTSEMEFRG